MRILFITPYIPSLIRVRPYNFIRVLSARGHEITLLALQPPGEPFDSLPQLREWCKAVYLVPHTRNQVLLNGLTGLLGETPFQAVYSRSPKFQEVLKTLLHREQFDLVHVEHLRGMVLAEGVKGLPIVFDSVDSISLLFEKVLKEAPGWKSRLMASLDLERTRRFEGRLSQRYQHIAICSDLDKQAMVDLGCDPNTLHYVPSCVNIDYFQPQEVERDPLLLIFSGKMSYHANIAASTDLVEQIMPLVWQKQPKVRLQIVGKDPSPIVQSFGNHPNITVTGYVPDLRPYLAKAAVAVCVVRYGVGLTTKTVEAMAMGTPVVASPHAVSTLKIENGREALVGDSPQALAQHIMVLLASSERA
jgi:glycosyltransferase involved in cell wall biosynthesis